MHKTVMVTGGAGYIGSHTVLALQDRGFNIVVVDNLSTGSRKLVPDGVDFYHVDISQSDEIEAIIKKHNIEAIIHFAGSIIVPESVENPLKYYLNNTVNSQKLIDIAIKTNVKNFVFSSTAAVYGIPEQSIVNENTTLMPINPYGASKLMTEQMLQDVHQAHGLNIGILRYFNVSGADHQGRSGQAMPNATHLIKVACEVMTKKRAHIEIFGTNYPTDDGTCVRDYIHVTDLAKAHLVVLDKLFCDGGKVITNCGYGRGYSVREVLECAEKVLGSTFEKIESPRRAGDPPMLVSDNHYLTQNLGWQPEYNDLFEIIQTAFNWEKKLNL
ncbi:MAG: UDP-glucose 4-epimerase [Alphaproteobacteria bacterium]|jgi:UDP-glucose 4-epimerase